MDISNVPHNYALRLLQQPSQVLRLTVLREQKFQSRNSGAGAQSSTVHSRQPFQPGAPHCPHTPRPGCSNPRLTPATLTGPEPDPEPPALPLGSGCWLCQEPWALRLAVCWASSCHGGEPIVQKGLRPGRAKWLRFPVAWKRSLRQDGHTW